MKDVQNFPDQRGIAIKQVGVSKINLPLFIKSNIGEPQAVVGKIKLTVSLPQEVKGTHMSRFIEVLNEWRNLPVGRQEIRDLLNTIQDKLAAKRADVEISFKYFIHKQAPISKFDGLLDVDCTLFAKLDSSEDMDLALEVRVPFTSLCPCSKEISDFGAHNQRGLMRVKASFTSEAYMYIEDFVRVMEQQASCPVYPLLKREDEKYVTEKAYHNPKFVEDVIRDLVIALRKRTEIKEFEVECENFESIHNHNAYAFHAETRDNVV